MWCMRDVFFLFMLISQILPKRDRVTEELEVTYFEKQKIQKQKNLARLEDQFHPISATADLATCSQTSTAYIGITHATKEEMQQCKACTTITSKKLAVIEFDATLKDIDYGSNGVFWRRCEF